MNQVDYLPLGSVVIMKGSVKKLVIVARAMNVNVKGTQAFFDYAACTYPEGMYKDQLMYFQHKDIMKVVFEGYSDEDDRMMINNIHDALGKTEVKRVAPEDLRNLVG